MKPEWRTSTVVDLCAAMRQTQEYSALPILADALQDAGCDDEKMLTEMRGRPDEMQALRMVALAYCEETASAVHKVTEWAPDFDLDYFGLMDLAFRCAHYDDFVTEYGSDMWRDRFYDIHDEFWECYEKITGAKLDDEHKGSPFNCSC